MLLAAGGGVSLTGDEQKTFRGGVFFESRQAGAAGRSLAGFHFDFAQRQPGFELGVDEVGFFALSKDRFETLCGLDSFP